MAPLGGSAAADMVSRMAITMPTVTWAWDDFQLIQ